MIRACFALGLVLALSQATPALAADVAVTASQLKTFQGAAIGGRAGKLIWRGGLLLSSPVDTFGGLSGIGFVGEGHLAMVSDRGNFVSGQLIYDTAGVPLSLVGVAVSPIRNSKGAALPRAFAQDAESLAVVRKNGSATRVRVGFENLTRVADFALEDNRPTGPAREIVIPDWLTRTRTNQTLEAICIAPPASPIAGSTLLLPENILDENGNHRAWLLGHRDVGPLLMTNIEGVNPTDCAFLPNGDLLVLERGVSLLSFVTKLVRVPAADVRPGALMQGEILLQATGGDIDNMEGLAVHTAPDGTTRITLISDNNFNDWERNLLLEFSLPDATPNIAKPPAPPVASTTP